MKRLRLPAPRHGRPPTVEARVLDALGSRPRGENTTGPCRAITFAIETHLPVKSSLPLYGAITTGHPATSRGPNTSVAIVTENPRHDQRWGSRRRGELEH